MAYSSPSPSGSSSSCCRRLSEVLGEQQEPFSLDLYLVERGCSQSFLEATACGGGSCSTCWPLTRSTGPTQRQPARKKKGSSLRSGVLRVLLSKILSGKTAPAATTNDRQQRVAIEWRRVAETERTPDTLELALPSASPRAVVAHMADGGEQDELEDDEEDESSKKQLSPVSVLEQRLFEHSPPPHAHKALAIFSELLVLDGAYTPTTLLDALAIAKDRSSSTQSKDSPRRGSSSSTPTPPPRVRRKKKREHRKQDTVLEKDVARVTALVASEMGGAGVGAEHLRASTEDVGAAIAAAVLEALAEEAAAELMGMDHGRAVDTDDADLRCWVSGG